MLLIKGHFTKTKRKFLFLGAKLENLEQERFILKMSQIYIINDKRWEFCFHGLIIESRVRENRTMLKKGILANPNYKE